MTKKEATTKSKIKCRECKRNILSSPDLYLIKWLTRDYTCIDCLETAYFGIKKDVASNNRNK